MYLTDAERDTVLQHEYFSAPVTEDSSVYAYYRGRFRATVYTVRFNVLADFNSSQIADFLSVKLPEAYPNQKLLGSINWDFLLVDPESDPKSYYIWKANSNQRHFDESTEYSFRPSYAGIRQFCTLITEKNIPDLNINFRSSKVQIDRLLAYVLTFMAY